MRSVLSKTVTSLLFGSLFFSVAEAGDELTALKTEPLAIPNLIDMSIKPGNIRNISELSLFAPLATDANSVTFMNLIGKKDNRDSSEFNLGFGKRILIDDAYVLGAFGHFDQRRTPYNNSFQQLTLGLEYFSNGLDVRFNQYQPITTSRGITPQRSLVQTPDSLLIRHADREYALAGWDAEIGTGYQFNQDNSFHIYAGHFDFRNNNTKSVRGNRYRAELRFYNLNDSLPANSSLSVGYETQKDKVRGRAEYGMLRISVPFGGPKHPTKLSGLERRLIDPVVRDVDIVSNINTRQEQAYFRGKDGKTKGQAKGIKRVTTGADLYRSTSRGKEGYIIILDKDISTSLTIELKKNQRLISGKTPVKLTTASGIKLNAVLPNTGTKTLKNTVPGKAPVNLQEGAQVSNVKLKKTTHDNKEIDADVLLSNSYNRVKVNPGESYQFLYQNISGKELTFSKNCKDCDGFSIDAKTGKITVTDPNFIGGLFNIEATNSDGKKYSTTLRIYTDKSLKEAEKILGKDGLLSGYEKYKGINLRYGKDYTCSGDDDKADATCDKSRTTKLEYVKKIIDSILDPKSKHTAVILAALKKSDANLQLNDNDDANDESLVTKLKFRFFQDLQATEVFTGGASNKGLSGDNTKRDAALEEVLHLVHNYGISAALPEWQERLDKITADALKAGRIHWPDANKDGIADDGDLPRDDLDDEYFALGAEAYFNIHGGSDGELHSSKSKPAPVCSSGGLGGNKCATGETSRQMLKDNHPDLYKLIEEIFGKKEKLLS